MRLLLKKLEETGGCAGVREVGRRENAVVRSSTPAAARASAAAADTRACGSSAPDWIYLLTITAKEEQGHLLLDDPSKHRATHQRERQSEPGWISSPRSTPVQHQ